MDAVTTPNGRWWLPPVLRLGAVFGVLSILGLIVWLLLQRFDLPSAGKLLDDYGYLGVALGAFGDSFGLPSSGEIVVLLASAAAAGSSHFSLPVVIVVAWVFAVAGDACAYTFGRLAGPRVLKRFGVHEDNSVHQFMERYGVGAVALGRLIAGIRTKLAIVAGSTKMPLPRYIIADAIGAAVWATALSLAGYFASSSVESLTSRFGDASSGIGTVALVIVAIAVVYLSVRYVLKHRPANA
jgi:membrane protein DedA with SNARE-associated domain